MKTPPSSGLYQDKLSVVRRFYGSEPPCVNISSFRIGSGGKNIAFREWSKLPTAETVTVTIGFAADRKGSCVLGVGCARHFEVRCRGLLCCSTYGEGKLYDLIAPGNHPFLVPVEKGENLLEIRLDRGNRYDLFCCRFLEKEALKLPVLLFPPVISHPGSGKVSIICRTAGDVGCGLKYRKKGSSAWENRWDQRGGLIRRRALHKFFLQELEPGADYEYKLLMIAPADPDVRKESRKFIFTAPPAETQGRFSFFFTADTQFPPAEQRSLLKALFQAGKVSECDFLVLGGDINSRCSPMLVEQNLFPVLQKYGAPGNPVVMVRGNHELRGPEPDSFADFWGNENEESFYMFRFGDTAFLVLDAWENRPAEHPRGKYYSRHNLDEVLKEEEKAFVARAVSSSEWKNARRRIVFAHGAGCSQYDSAGTMYRLVQELTDPYFEGTHPVSELHLFLAGHTHVYTRSCPGSDELCAFAMPPCPDKSAKDYIFPVLTCCGPNKKGLPRCSGFRVDAAEDGSLRVRSFLADGSCFEEIRIGADHSVEEVVSLPRFLPVKE